MNPIIRMLGPIAVLVLTIGLAAAEGESPPGVAPPAITVADSAAVAVAVLPAELVREAPRHASAIDAVAVWSAKALVGLLAMAAIGSGLKRWRAWNPPLARR